MFLLGIWLAGMLPAPAQDTTEKLQYLYQYIRQERERWSVPGLALAVVKDGEIIWSKGYGIREQGTAAATDSTTVFAVASTTMAITAAALGMIVDEGKVKWDDRVVDHWPEFQLFDPYVTREVRVRDLFTHNTGLGNADFLWFDSPLTSEEIMRRMRHARPAYPFRGGYTYQNIMYLAAGELIERLSGKPWALFVQQRIFDPLGMFDTYPNREASLGEDNRSKPHYKIDGRIQAIEDSNADAIAPAGAVWSSVADMAIWTRFVLDSARINGRRLLQPATYKEWLRPQIVIPPSQFYPTRQLTRPNWTTYALGWFQHDYRGRIIHFHTGSLPGTTAIIGLMPEEQLGVFILGNLDHAELRHALMYKVFDLFAFDDQSRDWSTEVKALYDRLEETAEKERDKRMAAQRANTQPSRGLEAYAGVFTDPYYGKVEVVFRSGALRISVNEQLNGRLEHWHYDTFQADWETQWRDESLVSFDLSPEGRVTAVSFDGRSFKRE